MYVYVYVGDNISYNIRVYTRFQTAATTCAVDRFLILEWTHIDSLQASIRIITYYNIT